MKRALLILALIPAAMLAAGCRGTQTDGADDPAAARLEPVLSVTAARVKIAPISSQIELLGSTDALRHVTLRAPSNGRVAGFNLQSGDHVRQGEIVAHIVNRELEAAQNGLAVAQKIDPQEAPSLKSSVDRYTGGAGVPVKAPATAIVSQRLVSSGQSVAYLDSLADLIDPNSVYIEAQVPINDASLVKRGMTATVTSPIRPGATFQARVAAMSPAFNANSETTPTRLEFVGLSRITIAGAAVVVHLTTRYVAGAVVIPASALFENARTDTYYVFVVDDNGIARRVPVTVGIRDSNHIQVTSGLKAGELVITSGGYALSDGLRVKVEPLVSHSQ